jgi:hypothetical protein
VLPLSAKLLSLLLLLVPPPPPPPPLLLPLLLLLLLLPSPTALARLVPSGDPMSCSCFCRCPGSLLPERSRCK